MLKFVKGWISEATKSKDEKEIEKDGTCDKWTECTEGLPHSDRDVEVMVYEMPGKDGAVQTVITSGKFNPHIGWHIKHKGIVVGWRDFDKKARELMQSVSLMQRLTAQ